MCRVSPLQGSSVIEKQGLWQQKQFLATYGNETPVAG